LVHISGFKRSNPRFGFGAQTAPIHDIMMLGIPMLTREIFRVSLSPLLIPTHILRVHLRAIDPHGSHPFERFYCVLSSLLRMRLIGFVGCGFQRFE
jgi:hypothetical protein